MNGSSHLGCIIVIESWILSLNSSQISCLAYDTFGNVLQEQSIFINFSDKMKTLHHPRIEYIIDFIQVIFVLYLSMWLWQPCACLSPTMNHFSTTTNVLSFNNHRDDTTSQFDLICHFMQHKQFFSITTDWKKQNKTGLSVNKKIAIGLNEGMMIRGQQEATY